MKLRYISAAAAGASIVALGIVLSLNATAAAPTTDTIDNPPIISQAGKQVDGTPANATTCAQAGLTGSLLLGDESPNQPTGAAGQGTKSGSPEAVTLLINPGYTITGVVVKGGPGYIVYGPFGPSANYIQVTNLLPPVNPGEQNPKISHWFVCGTGPSTSPSPSGSESPGPSGSVSPGPSGSTTVGTPSPATSTDPGRLPTTGMALTGIIAAGVALVAGGTALLFVRRRRTAAGE
jgi:LPXTG-motif cell wall-anchored protein